MNEINKAPKKVLMLWSSIPCTGGSTWQYVNMANYRRRDDVEAIRRLRDFRRTYRKSWRNLTMLARLVMDSGGIVAIEWPVCVCVRAR
eukprot:2798677-Prorocentrum_lima.AAC.1